MEKERNKLANDPLNDPKHASRIFDSLNMLKIEYKVLNHKPVFTCEEAMEFDNLLPGAHCKNLFVCNKKQDSFYLVTAIENTPIKLNEIKKAFPDNLQCVGKISFAKHDLLAEKLGIFFFFLFFFF